MLDDLSRSVTGVVNVANDGGVTFSAGQRTLMDKQENSRARCPLALLLIGGRTMVARIDGPRNTKAVEKRNTLTSQELAVLTLLAQGQTDEMIGRRLHISARTCRRVVSGLLQTLGVKSRFQAGAAAAIRGWITQDMLELSWPVDRDSVPIQCRENLLS